MAAAIIGTALVTFLFAELIGYLVHRLAHSRKGGKLYESHMVHHSKIYPPSSFQSDKYIHEGITLVSWFAPVFALIILLQLVVLPWTLFITSAVVTVSVSIANWLLHDMFHLNRCWLDRFGWFSRTRRMHYLHHKNMKKNFGIYWFGWDRFFRTLRVR